SARREARCRRSRQAARCRRSRCRRGSGRRRSWPGHYTHYRRERTHCPHRLRILPLRPWGGEGRQAASRGVASRIPFRLRAHWVMGEGLVEDVTTHPATRAMVDEYVAWYDLHLDPAWQEIAIRPPDAESKRIPWAYVMPKSADDLAGMGRFFSATTFLSAGNITHTPCYGHMIALGLLASVEER